MYLQRPSDMNLQEVCMHQSKHPKLISVYSMKRYRNHRKGKKWYFRQSKKFYSLFIARNSVYRSYSSIYRPRRERQTNTYPKVIRIADFLSNPPAQRSK